MSLVNIEVTDRVATLTLQHPGRRNALTLELADALGAAVDQAEAMGAGAMIITGEGEAFCAGADLDELARAEGPELVRVYRSFSKVYQSAIPSIAAVNGPAVGAGFNLALCCDVILASPDAVFDAGFLRLNVHPGGGASWLLQRRLGLQAANAFILFMEKMTGDEAANLGLAWRCVAADQLLPLAREIAARPASKPPMLMQKMRHTLQRMEEVDDHGRAIALELDEQLWSLNQPEAKEAIAALRQQISGG